MESPVDRVRVVSAPRLPPSEERRPINGNGAHPAVALPAELPARWGRSSWYPFLLFARNFFRFPGRLGTIFPSSPFLVRRTLDRVAWSRCDVLVEYGPGVGHFTREILKRMHATALLVAIEINADFVQYLQSVHRDPRLCVMHGSAAEVRTLLRAVGRAQADCVIAGIPFSTLPRPLVKQIVRRTHSVLSEDGTLLVYQVSRAVLPHLRAAFPTVDCELEVRSIMPTQLFRCRKTTSGSCRKR